MTECLGPRVSDLMTPSPVSVAPATLLAEAARLLAEEHIRHLPVIDGLGRLRGLLSNRDLLHAHLAGYTGSGERTVVLIMTTGVESTDPSSCAVAAGRRMFDLKIGCFPVLDAEGILVGILSESDYLRYMFRESFSDCQCTV